VTKGATVRMSAPGPQRRFAAMQQDARNGRLSGPSADAVSPPDLTQSRHWDGWTVVK
jgi:hypothetical protein